MIEEYLHNMDLLWVVITIAGIGIVLVIIYRLYREINQSSLNPNKLPIQPTEHAESKINAYWDGYLRYRIYLRLKSHYCQQFDMQEYSLIEPPVVDTVGSLTQMGLDLSEIELGRSILKKRVHDCLNCDASHFTEGRCLSILFDFSDLLADLTALDSIRDKVTDNIRYDRYKKLAEERLKELKSIIANQLQHL